jgi:hypothetical protein
MKELELSTQIMKDITETSKDAAKELRSWADIASLDELTVTITIRPKHEKDPVLITYHAEQRAVCGGTIRK